MSEIAPVANSGTNQLDRLQEFETELLGALDRVGLPSTDVLVGIDQRARVFQNYPGAIDLLDNDKRQQSMYLSKMLAAVAVGLFDAALNYLWDETVSELRRRIARYDLAYFFDIAVPSPERRRGLRSESDLAQLPDQDLIRASYEIGLVSEIGYQQLDLIRYMRNYASAAHPNQNEINAFQLLGWIETCIKEVITLPESRIVAETKRLLANVRNGLVTADNSTATAEFFSDLPPDQADNLAAGFFGQYVMPESNESARDGVRLLLPHLWIRVSESKRHEFGLKYGKYVANGDTDRSERARELLDVVEGAAYLPEQVRVAEISAAVDELLIAHRGHNNFYTEPTFARRLLLLTGEPVPDSVKVPYVGALVEVFLTNGNGVAWAADPHYVEMISRFDPSESEQALVILFDPIISSTLRWEPAQLKYVELLDLLEPKLTRPAARDLMEGIRSFSSSPSDLPKDSSLKRLIARL